MQEDHKRKRIAKEGEQWVQVRLADETVEALRQCADSEGSSISLIVRRLVMKAIREGKP